MVRDGRMGVGKRRSPVYRTSGKPECEMELTVERLAWGGLGLSRDPEGRLILLRAPLALFPGEVVRADVVMKARHGEGEVKAWLRTAPDRVTPGCPVAGTCGGCELWGAGEAADELKRSMVADLLQRQLPDIQDWGWRPAPPSALRHRVQLHWDGGHLGFHRRKSHAVVAVEGCPAAAPPVAEAIPLLREALASGALPGRPQRWELAAGTPAQAVWAIDERGRAWRLQDCTWTPVPEGESIRHDHRSIRLDHRAGGFFQVCAPWAMEAIGDLLDGWDVRGGTLYDLYGGVGLFSALAGSRFRHRVLVEWDVAAVEHARANLAALHLPAECHGGDVGAWLPEALGSKEDTVVLDPPRAGLDPGVAAKLQSSLAGRLILMGCDGAAFCRDVKRLAPRWKLRKLVVLDLFPQTHHVECVGLFD